MQKPYNVIIYGATGYSGTITAEYLAKRPNVNIKWAISGRSEDKLKALASKLSGICNHPIDYFVADATQYDQILELAQKTAVLCSFVGPYRKFGEPIVKACVNASTDYVDVTGEPPYIRDVVQKYSEQAADRHVYLLPACGIGSLVTDMAVEILKQEFGKAKVIQATTYVKYNGRYAKSFSNGTWNTLINSMANKKKLDTTTNSRRHPSKPSPSTSEESKKTRPKRVGFHYYGPLRCFAVPFVEGADLLTVRTSNEQNLSTTGTPEFSYAQLVLMPLFPPPWLLWTLFLLFLVMYFSRFETVRNWLLSRSDANGGPTESERAQSSIDIWVEARDTLGNQKRLHLHCPGPYDSTGIACAEAALVLATDRDNVKKSYGLTTPASSMSEQLKINLVEHGHMVYHIEDKTK